MKVKELIERLSELNPEHEVIMCGVNDFFHRTTYCREGYWFEDGDWYSDLGGGERLPSDPDKPNSVCIFRG